METINAVTSALVADDRRPQFLPRFFSRYMLKVEAQIFSQMRGLCEAYHGGYWNFYELSNGGAFMAPAAQALLIEVDGNGYQGSMSAEAAGITATLFALSSLSFRYSDAELLAERFHQLRAFALDHPEAGAIFSAID
jgi:hypothetical protein